MAKEKERSKGFLAAQRLINEMASSNTVNKEVFKETSTKSKGESKTYTDPEEYVTVKLNQLGLNRSNVDSNYISSFFKDAQSYLKSAESDYNGISFNNKDSVFAQRKKQTEDLRSRSWEIRQYLDKNKAVIGDESYKSIIDTLDEFDRASMSTDYSFYKKNKGMSQFNNEADYNNFLRQQELSTKSSAELMAEQKNRYVSQEDKDIIHELMLSNMPYNREYAEQDGRDMAIYDEVERKRKYISDKYGIHFSESSYENDKLLSSLMDGEVIAYTTGDGQNVTWDMLFNNALMAEDLASRFDTYYKNADWAEKSQGIDTVADTESDFQIVSSLARSNVPYDWKTAEANGIDKATFDDVERKRQYISEKYGVDLYSYIYNNVNTLNDLMAKLEGEKGATETFENLSYLTDEEKAVLSYIYNTEGRAAALDWHNSRKGIYQGRFNKYLTQGLTAVGEDSPFWGSVGSVALSLGSSVEYLTDLFDYMATGEAQDNTLARASSSVRAGVMETVDWEIGNWDAFDFLYSTGMSMADSWVGGKIGGIVGQAAGLEGKALQKVAGNIGGSILGLSAAAQATNDALDRGMSNGQAFWNGLVAGTFEGLFESWSIGNFNALQEVASAHGKDIAMNIAKSMLVNASEETLTEIANVVYDSVFNGDFSQYETLVRQYVVNGYSEKEAKSKAALDLGRQVVEAGASGLLMGLGFGTIGSAGPIAGNAVSSVKSAIQTNAFAKGTMDVNGGLDALQSLANDVMGVSDPKLQNKLKKQSDKVKNKATAWNVGKLYNTVSEAYNTQNKADIATILEMNRFDSKTANDLAEAIVTVANGKQLTNKQTELLDEYKNNDHVRGVINGYDFDERSTIGKRNKAIGEFKNDVAIGVMAKKYTEKVFTPSGEYKVSNKGKATVLETEEVDGKTITKDNGEIIEIKGVKEVRKTEVDGKTKVELILDIGDGKEINAKNVAYANKKDALIYEAIANLGANINADTANKLIKKYDGGNAMVFARGIAQAYSYGLYGLDRSEMKGKHTLSADISEAQRNYAYGLGEKYRAVKEQEDKDSAKVTKAPSEKGVYYRGNDGTAVDIRTYLKESKIGLKDVQKTAIEAMEKMSAMMGVRFNVFESWVENGTRYYLDENGKKTKGNPNGFYDTKTGEIYIDLHAGNDYQGTMLFTVAHELTHFMKQWSPEHFNKIAQIVFQHGGMKGNVAKQAAIKMTRASAKGKPISYEVALEEVVADGMETILKDGKVLEFMEDVKKKDHGAWVKIKEWFKKLAEFLKELVDVYGSHSAQTVEGAKVAEFAEDLLDQIKHLYAEGAVEAGDAYRAAQEQFSTDTIRGNADGAVVKNETTEALTTLQSPRTEYEALPKQVMNLSDGAGTILSFIEGLTPTEVKGLSGKGINGYTGRDVRGYAMGISGFTQAQIKAVNKFMDTMADFMEEAGVTYKFIGLQDVENAQLHYTYNADGSIKSIVLSAMVKNGDYPVNFDLSSICKKRVAMSTLIDKLAKRGSLDNGTVKLTPANIFKINTALKDAGYETACLGCFVESKRYNSLEWAKKFCNKWNAAVKKVNPNATYFGYGDATFNEDSFTLEQAVKIDEAATKYIKATKTERLQNALAKYRAKEQAGQPLVQSFSKAALDRLVKSNTISDELKTKYLNCDPTTLNIADVEFLLENGILPGAALTNKQAVTEMVKSGEAYQYLLRPSDLLTDRGISKLEALPNFHGVLYGHYGSGTPKLMQSYTPYNSEIALLPSKKGDQSLAEYLYTIAGVRMQSFSDFQIQNIYDYLQMVGDLAARKVPAHAYTKELPFAKLLGMTGIKVNLSVMFDIDPMVDKAHAGLTKLNKLVHRGEYAKVVLEDEQGRWVYNIGDYQTQKLFAEAYPDEAKRFLQSIGFADAVKLQSSTGYSANCGIIGVGYSDLGIFAMLDDNRIRYIIPYHASSLPAEIKLATHIALGTDYTPYQNNMKIKEIVDRNGKKVNWTIKEAYKRLGSGQAVINELNDKVRNEGWVVTTSKAQTGHGTYGLYEDLQQTNDPRQTASNFMDWCIGNSTLPLFYQFASHENYYKLIYDYNVYDCVTEEYAPQQAVTNTYPTMVDGQVQPGNVIDGGFDAEYFKGTIDKQMAFMEAYSRNLDEDLGKLAENMEEGKYTLYSDRDTDYLDAVNRGDMETAQKMADEAAKSAGFPVRLLHGTQQFGFTVPDTSASDDKLSFFATSDVDTAKTYSSLGGKRGITEAEDYGSIEEESAAHEENARGKASELADKISRWVGYYGYVDGGYIHERFMEIANDYETDFITQDQADQQMYEFADDIIAQGYSKDAYDGQEFWEWQESEEAETLYTEVNKTISAYFALADFGIKAEYSGNYDLYANTDGLLVIEGNGAKWNDIKSNVLPDITSEEYKKYGYRGHWDKWTTRSISKYASDNGYRGVLFKNIYDDGGKSSSGVSKPADVYSFFYPQEQVKSADPVTYDDKGNVIPLSERFNQANDDIRYSERVSNQELAEMDETALYIKNTDKANYIGMIFNGTKTEETRSRRTLDAFIGKDFYVTDGKRVYGSIVLGEPHKYTEAEFHKKENRLKHRVPKGDKYDIKPGGIKWAYPIESYKKFDKPKNLSDSTEYKNSFQARQVLYQDRTDDSVSNRSLLANAFEGIAKSEELPKIQEYKDMVALINEEEKKLRELNEQIKELSFAKGPRDNKRIKALRFDAVQAANRINTYDKQLLRLEASKPLQDVLTREKKLAYKKAEQRGKEALADYKAKVEAQQKKTTEKWRESRKTAVAKARETAEKRDARAKLQKLVLDTVKWISYPAKTDVKCPDILKKPYEAFLQGIDLSSKRLANGGEATNNDLRLANAMDSLATAIDRVMLSQDPAQEVDKVLDIGYLDLPANFVQNLRKMTEDIKSMMVEGEYVVNTMTADEVRKLSQTIRTLNHAIKTMSKLYANLRFANVEALGFDTMDFLNTIGEIENTGGMKDFVQWDNALPYYAFKRFGKGGESIFEGLMDAQDKLAFLAQDIFSFQEKTWTGKEAKEWSEDTHTIDLPNGNKLTLTTADAMSIYCLSRREHALPHLLGGGVRVMGIQKGSQKAKDSRSLLTIKDVDAIISSLTDRQKQVAEGIQEFMSTVCSEWGNEISMKRFLTREFTEKFYFPIESNDENLTARDPAAQQSDLFRLLNISATKPLTEGANNEVIIRNIFDVFTGHASDMARLNAYGMGLLDYMKWLNYRERGVNEEGQIDVKGVRKSMEKAYGNAANSYVLNLIKDVNGRASDGGDPSILMKWMRAAKTASVGSSLRVATLQITSYPRAGLVLSPKSLALGLTKMPNIEKAKKYCGIALWKSFGFYDTNISRSIEDQMKGVKDIKQKLIELSLKGAEWGDAITWGALWNACEYEVAQTTQNKVGSEEFYQEVGKKLREVVYRTQVVDSTLTRSQIMRSKRGMAQEATAFMSEPTLSANILMDAGFEFGLEKRRTGSVKDAWKKTGSYIGRAVAVYAIGQLTAALMEALWDAWRDDEDEEFGEKYLSAFAENLALDLVPFNKLPIISDVFEGALSLFGVGFFSSDKMSSTWLTQALSAVDAWKKVFRGESSTTVYNALYKSTRALSSFYGVAFGGLMREGVALWNNTAGAYDSTLKIRQYDLSNANLGIELYEAIISGNTRQADSLKAQFEDVGAMHSAVRKALRENDPRIKEAAVAGFNGDPSERVRIARLIIADGFDQDDVVMAINAEIADMKPDDGSSDPKKKGFYTASDFATEIAKGDQASAYAAKEDIIATAQKNGKTAEQAEDSFVSSAKSELKKLFMAGKISSDKITGAYVSFFGMSEEDAEDQVEAYDWERQGYEGATKAAIREYYEYCSDTGVPKDVYLHIRKIANNTENDVDANGKTIYYSAMRKIMAEIDGQSGLTSSQKTAIARSLGWADKNINKYKTW